MQPVCLVIGAGAGIGGTVGRRFAGWVSRRAVPAQRCEGLKGPVDDRKQDGGSATGYWPNAVQENRAVPSGSDPGNCLKNTDIQLRNGHDSAVSDHYRP